MGIQGNQGTRLWHRNRNFHHCFAFRGTVGIDGPEMGDEGVDFFVTSGWDLPPIEEMAPDHKPQFSHDIKHIPAGRPSFATSFDLCKEVSFTPATNND